MSNAGRVYTGRVYVLGTEVDALTVSAAAARILDLARTHGRHIVVTPNLDHLVKLRRDARFREAYAHASLALADGMPLVWASYLGARRLPERVAGADLVEPILAGAERDGLSVFFVGPMADTLEAVLERIAVRYPRLILAGALAPPMNFQRDPALDAQCADAVRAGRPDIVFVCLGAPKQELWIAKHRESLDFGVALCFGAALDFIAGVHKRCPPLLARLSLEWAWRMTLEPRRLWWRYAQCLLFAPVLVWEQLRHAWHLRTRG